MISQSISADLKGLKENINCTIDDVGDRFLGMPHGTTPATVTTKNIKMSSFKSSENIQKKDSGPDRSFSDYQSSLELDLVMIISQTSYRAANLKQSLFLSTREKINKTSIS